MTEYNNLLKFVFSVLISFVCISALPAAAQEQAPRSVGQRAQALQERRQHLEQDAADAQQEIETEYAKWVALINSGQTPDDTNVSDGLKFIARNRKFLPILNRQQKGDFYSALSAWVYYFDDKPDKAMRQIVSAYKITPQNTNVVKTYFALSLIYRDYSPLAEIIAAQEISPSVEEPSILQDSSYQQPSGAELNLDISRIRSDLLGKTFDIHSKISDYNSSLSGKKLACLFLWKLDPNELEKFTTAAVPAPVEKTAELVPSGESEFEETAGQQEQIYESRQETDKKNPEIDLFSQLQNQFAKNTDVVFAAVNFNAPDKAKNVKNWLAENPQQWQAVPPSAQLQQAVTSFIGSAPDTPMLLIISPDSAVRYLGNIDSFLPQMLISNILANLQEFADSNEPNQPLKLPKAPPLEEQTEDDEDQPQTTPQIEQAAPEPSPVERRAEQTPAQDRETPKETTPPAQPKNQIDEDFFDPRAETLIEHARAFFKIANRLQHHTYSKPVEMCKTVIKDYPNTKYSEQAGTLMRQVPERFRERFDITDEELGL
ncbi:MAG: hypothetical protein CVV39_05265 [Planctomycetes bacterium HGW-Planctomycetes-1]|nr:MAG: hypothetical protein CVV39_05265 [Planctomycetes bacterium HGW-Planctomycetes-1]